MAGGREWRNGGKEREKKKKRKVERIDILFFSLLNLSFPFFFLPFESLRARANPDFQPQQKFASRVFRGKQRQRERRRLRSIPEIQKDARRTPFCFLDRHLKFPLFSSGFLYFPVSLLSLFFSVFLGFPPFFLVFSVFLRFPAPAPRPCPGTSCSGP